MYNLLSSSVAGLTSSCRHASRLSSLETGTNPVAPINLRLVKSRTIDVG